MRFNINIIVLLLLFSIFSCKSSKLQVLQPKTHLFDMTFLENSKHQIENGNKNLQSAYNKLFKEANKALNEGSFSVTQKEHLAPSNNKHDYASYSRYWWPNPETVDGLPYIRKDGETNPDSQSLEYSDRQRIGKFSRNTESLALAYYFTNNEKYANKVAQLLRVWFIDEATKMNPNVNHSQIRRGHNNGTKSGVLDGRLLISAFESAQLISNSSALNKEEYHKLKQWANDYLKWLTTSELALAEAKSKNNHGSFYDVQALYFALYAEDNDLAIKIAQNFIGNRLNNQIQTDGSMPEEMARTRPLFYSIYNLHAMFLVATMAEKVDVDIWQAENENSKLKDALDFLAPYADINKKWPTPMLKEADRTKLFEIFQMAERAYPNQGYLNMAEVFSKEQIEDERSNLAMPLMR